MKNIFLSAAILVSVCISCATLSGKIGASKIDALSDRCLAENDGLKPVFEKWHDLSTQDRTKQKKELSDYKKDRIELYQNLHAFKQIYLNHVESDGSCKKAECRALVKLREKLMLGCPTTGESFPRVASK
ncbi:MAG: hypothetical protein JXA07_15100 [Spirochaetes bacterium]|nr:hypothetical protein [Spirochaetota bacterium]